MNSTQQVPKDEFAVLRAEAKRQRQEIVQLARATLGNSTALALESRGDTLQVNGSLLRLLSALEKHRDWAFGAIARYASRPSTRLQQYESQQRDTVVRAEQSLRQACDESLSRGFRANAVVQLVERLLDDLERVERLASDLERASGPASVSLRPETATADTRKAPV